MKTTDEYLRILRNGKTYLMQAYHIIRGIKRNAIN